MNFQKT